MFPLEIGLGIFLLIWALGSVLFVLPLPRAHRWLASINRCRFFVRWGVFSNRDPQRRAGTFELVVRESNPGEGAPRWRTVASGYSWSGRSFGWWPPRYSAAAIQNLGRQIHMSLAQVPPAWQLAMRRARVLADYAVRADSKAPAPAAEFRLLRRFPSGRTPDEVVLVFSRVPEGHGD